MDDILAGNTVDDAEAPLEAGNDAELQAEEPVDAVPEQANGVSNNSEEHETIRAWKEKQASALAERDAKADAADEELKKQAAEELAKLKADHAKGIEERAARNKEDEESFISQRDNATPGSEWERVAFHCNFNVKANNNQKDFSRMRSILLQVRALGKSFPHTV
eukprot:TRINITY_DN4680_c0_g1_i3.p1 TRINITY_DN4680_c0_g1~~TRINITY_DN4680_c0_g1_i3.p1  ORF type:complete len:189 (+),score=62.08 TRINITY_DN4680_c0_g1_i3:78-569(+)